MKSLMNLLIICSVFCFTTGRSKAQIFNSVSVSVSLKTTHQSTDNLISSSSLLYLSSTGLKSGRETFLTDINNKPGFTFINTDRSYIDLINRQAVLNLESAGLPALLTRIEDYKTSFTFSFNWKNEYGLTFIDPAIAYYCQFKKSDDPSICGCRLYRAAGFVIPRMLEFSYPHAKTSIYPPPYMQPKAPFDWYNK
jgi:hypothetical protein